MAGFGFVYGVGLMYVAALVARPTRVRGPMALTLAVLALAGPFFLQPDAVGLRALLGFHGSVAMLRVIDLVRDQRPWSAARRLWLITILIDVRRAEPIEDRALRTNELLRFALFGALCLGAFAMALKVAPTLDGAPRLLVRWLGALIGFYSVFECLMLNNVMMHRFAGYKLPLLHDDPILSRSVKEFWAKRWNLTISDWLRRNCLVPLARRNHAVLGMLAAFVVSALVHWWQVFVCLPIIPSLLVFGFFVLQGVVVFIERGLGVLDWPPAAGHAWTVTIMLISVPLLMEPLMMILDSAFS